MARFCSLFSSSSGNSTYIGSSKTGILIDAGVSAKKMKEALLGRDIDPAKLGGIFITHEHSDHIKGVRILASTYKIPVFATEGTMSALEENGVVTAIESGSATITVTTEDGGHTAICSVTVKKENDFNIGDWEDDGTDDGGTAN
jgi:phosphoribosyl 1,2-cyclic phosphodiesterase